MEDNGQKGVPKVHASMATVVEDRDKKIEGKADVDQSYKILEGNETIEIPVSSGNVRLSENLMNQINNNFQRRNTRYALDIKARTKAQRDNSQEK